MQTFAATFTQDNSLQINSTYQGPRAVISTTIPYLILVNDILQMDYNTGLTYASSSSLLTIQYLRHDTLIFN
jgi:hypothetical protein